MKGIIQEVQADDQWAIHNGHEQGDAMFAEEMELHDALDYDDDTALNCIELGQALQDLETADLDDECNVIAPFVMEGNLGTQNDVEAVAPGVFDGLDFEIIDVDALELEVLSPSESEGGSAMDFKSL